jgi:hypothetical protein
MAVAHCHPLLKTLDEVIQTLQNLTCVTSVTDVIREMCEQKCAGYVGKAASRKNI